MTEYLSFFDEAQENSSDLRFLRRVFTWVAKKQKNLLSKATDAKRIAAEEYTDLSRRLDKSHFQDSCQVRNVLKARRIAKILITDEGDLDLGKLSELIDALKLHCYVLGPKRHLDTPRNEHILKALMRLNDDKHLQRQLKQISKPDSHKIADQILRDTIGLPTHLPLNDAETKRAVLSAWLCYLRQNVGSCFATAPAILVQREQPEVFLKDMNELLATGRIKRTFGGVEYAVPLSSSPGVGDYKKHVLLDASREKMIQNLSLSPGLLSSLEATKIIEAEKPLKEKVEEAKKLILDAIAILRPKEAPYLLITAEEIIRCLLMQHFKISQKDLEDYEKRPRAMLHTSLLMTPSKMGSGMGGKGEAVLGFLSQSKVAEIAFNSLTDNPLLKTWEYTLASFAETKPGFTRWNMYASLGFNHEEPGGIGAALYEEIKRRLDQTNRKVEELQYEYEQIYTQLQYIQAKLRNVASEKEAAWGKIEFESKRGEFRTIEELRDRENFKAKRFANLINDLLDAYDTLFPKYFQEVYDPNMHEVSTGPYDDSPAGFRLLYKHGRANTSQWTLIYTPQEFVEALSSFFVATEPELVHLSEFKGLESDISEIVTSLVSHVKTDGFLNSAFYRMAKAHNTPFIKDPLDHLDQIDKKPWAYTSGGTMNNLISCYFRLDGQPFEASRWVENEMELLVFVIDSIRGMPHKISDPYLKSTDLSLLMHSPTHAFTIRPGFPRLKEAITTDVFSFTFARDELVRPAQRFTEYLFLDDEMIQALLNKFKIFLPERYHIRFEDLFREVSGKKNCPEFRLSLTLALEHDSRLQWNGEPVLSKDQIDSALFQWLPFCSSREIKNRAEKILAALPGIDAQHRLKISKVLDVFVDRWEGSPLVPADQLQDLCKAALTLALGNTSVAFDYPALIREKAGQLGYAMPMPVIFADTNWVKDYFAFLVNPGTGVLDFWRTDSIGAEGSPMSMWRKWFDGSDKTRTWGIYTKPYEYKI